MKLKFITFVIASLSLLTSCGNSSKVLPHEDTGREGFLNLYALNDYHGRISYNEKQKQNGISRVSAFLNEQKYNHELEYVLFNSGDLWQDTFESNSNKGACLTEAMDVMGCEAMALGNHEFDWSLDVIKENRKNAGGCEFLGANIFYYDKDNHRVTTHADDLCSPYKIVERNGFKIGVIGIIGKNQITSITSTKWEDISFVDPLDVVKSYSDELRKEKQCDLIVLLSHADTESLSYNFCESVTSISDETLKPYIDCCFTGHSHILENKTFNEIPFVQGGFAGEYISHIEFDMRGNTPKCVTSESLFVKTNKNDAKIDKIVDKYITNDFKKIRDEKVCTFTNTSSITASNAGRLQALATYECLKHVEEEKGIKITAALNNGGRDTVRLPGDGVLTREMLFNLTPFTNKTYIARVSGANLSYAIRNNRYYAPKQVKLVSSEYYYIACIDYVLLHKSADRKYDNFNSFDGTSIYIEESYPDEIIYNFVKGKTFDKSLFSMPEFTNLS